MNISLMEMLCIPVNEDTTSYPVIGKGALRYSKIPNYFVPDRSFSFRNYFDSQTKKWWFYLDDVCFISCNRTDIDVSRYLNREHYTKFEIIHADNDHKVKIFVDTVGLFLLLNRAPRDVRKFYIDQILTLLIVPCMTSKRKCRKSTTELPVS